MIPIYYFLYKTHLNLDAKINAKFGARRTGPRPRV